LMPPWVAYIVGAAALIAAVGVIWNKLVKPLAKMIALAEKMLPLLAVLTDVFKDDPDALKVLNEIAAQFKADSGSSLRDVVNRLEVAAQKQEANAEGLKIGVETVKQVAGLDRERVERLTLALDRASVKLDETVATVGRIERHASTVADDLAAAHKRADEVPDGDAGSAADAAARQTEREKREDDRQGG
jgi:hypothetical protein